MSLRTLSVCPECGTEVLSADLLIEYERDSSETAGYAACRRCERVVKVTL